LKLKETATEAFSLLCEVYTENTLSRDHMFEWHKRLSEGREDVEDDDRPGRTLTMKTDKIVEKMRSLVRTDRR